MKSNEQDPFSPFNDAGVPKEFAATSIPKEFSGSAAADDRFRDFVTQERPIERYGGEEQPPSVQQVISRATEEARRTQFSAIGQLVIIIMGKRTIDFSKHGPMIGYNGEGLLKINTPVRSLPTRTVMKDSRGNLIEDLSQVSPRRRAALLKTAKPVKVAQRIEDYAAGTWNESIVLAPITGMVFHTLADQGHQVATIQFFPDERQQWPMMLYHPTTGRFELVGGGGHVIR